MSASTNIALPFLTQGQAQKHITVNESLLRLDALVQLCVVSATTTAQPASPTDGAVYIVPSGKTGADWSLMSNYALAYYRDGIWETIAPREGWLAYAKDTDILLHYTGAAWTAFVAGAVLTVSATDKILGRVSSGAGAAEEITFTDQAQALCDDTSFADMRTTLGAVGATGAETIAGVKTFTSTPVISGTAWQLTFSETDQATDEKLWGLRGNAKSFSITTRTDADGAGVNALTITRGTGTALSDANFGAGVTIGSPTGGNKGAGTLNATAVYDDNVLLTCGPLELLREGAIDLEKWDAIAATNKAEPARHHVMRHFQKMLDDGFDPRDADNFCARMKRDGAVPGLFTEAEWSALLEDGEKPDIGTAMTRTFLALDNLSVAFSAALDRIAALEAK